ncbi:phosphoglycerate kinase [Desulfogranum mediterraneum]|uniref:phosphoglycerate kinase n=1 Tax=Desulfogranum mediterraneum TaxID=160661 RepID=UPI00041E1945|nr:phosphoglycerate kinase [Desulfogranum mediterraneum]
MKTLVELEVSGKRVLVRVDFNVPMTEAGEVADDLRIQTALPTIKLLLERQAKVIICTHMGRPKGEKIPKYSLAPVAEYLAALLDLPVTMAPDCIGPEAEAVVAAMAPGEVVMLENLRYYQQEVDNDPDFAAQLASLAELYVNDAFAVSHRAHASVVGIPKLMTAKAAGLLLEKELAYFKRSCDQPQRPLVAIVGGAKVSGKLEALENMLARVDRLILGGAMANTFLKSQGYEVGASKVEEDLLESADRLLQEARRQQVKVYLPVDVVAAERFAPDAVAKQVTIQDIPPGWMALDIGPASVLCFQEVLADAKTIVWNGPMGAFEMDAFSRGTTAIAHCVAASHALSVTGGGDSNAAIKLSGEAANISYMSTGGGAFLMLMEGKELPGVAALA